MINGQNWRAIALALIVGICCSGCVSGDYAKAVGDYSKTVQKSETVFEDINQQSIAAEDRRTYQRARTDAANLKFKEHSCERQSTDCSLVFNGRTVPAKSLLGNVSALLGDVSAYAKGLNDIASADTRADIDKAMSSIQTDLKQLAATAKVEGPALNYVDPAGAAIGWIVGTYLDHVRYDAAREAVIKADPVIAGVAKVLGLTANQLDAQVRNELAEEVRARRKDFFDTRSKESYDALLASVRMYDGFVKLKYREQFAALGTAHAELKKAFESGKFGTAIEQIDAWQRQVEEVGKIIGAFVDAGKKK